MRARAAMPRRRLLLCSESWGLLLGGNDTYSGDMPIADFVCISRLRVRWAEADMQEIVFNGHYLTYIDTAVAEYWREIGLPYPEGYVERYASDVFLRKATVEYLGSARYDDVLAVCFPVAQPGPPSLTF